MSFSKFQEMISDASHFISDTFYTPWSRRNDPEWLKSIQGDFPLLRREEWEYIAEVRHKILKEAKPNRPNLPSDQRLKYKLSVAKNNFEEIVKFLKESSASKKYFKENYPSWRSFRDLSICQLKNIAIKVDMNRRKSAATRSDASSVSLFGGLLSLVPGLGLVRFAGGVLVGLGSLASLAVSYVEFEEFQKMIKEAEKILLEDRAYTEKLWDWMNNMSHIDEAYKAIQDMDAMDLKKIANDLLTSFKMKKDKSEDTHTKVVDNELIINIGKTLLSLKFSPGMINEIADLIAIFLSTSLLYDRYRTAFNLAFETYKFKRILCKSGNLIVSTAQAASFIGARKIRLGIGIALDIITIMQASKDMDMMCKEAIEIQKVAERLREEAEIFKKIYDAVRRG